MVSWRFVVEERERPNPPSRNDEAVAAAGDLIMAVLDGGQAGSFYGRVAKKRRAAEASPFVVRFVVGEETAALFAAPTLSRRHRSRMGCGASLGLR